MKVIRCKDCVLDGRSECPLAYIENQMLCFVEHSPMFFCAKGKAKEDYTPTRGDNVRNMTDRQLATLFNETEHEIAKHYTGGGGAMSFGKKNIDFYTKWFSEPEEDD